MQNGNVGGAIGHYEQALRIKPDYAMAHYNLGFALAQTGKIEDAIAHYQQALRINPDYAEATTIWGSLWRKRVRSRKPSPTTSRPCGSSPITPRRTTTSGPLWRKPVRSRKPSPTTSRPCGLTLGFAEAHYNLANALFRVGKVTDAIAHYRQSLQINPGNADAHSKLGAALIATGNAHDALGQLEQALRINPDLAEAQNNLAWVLATLPPTEGGDPVRAVALAQRVCERSGHRAPGDLDTLAVAYAAAGRFDDAIATARNAIDLARAAGQAELVKEIEARLELYRTGRAYSPSTGATNPTNP